MRKNSIKISKLRLLRVVQGLNQKYVADNVGIDRSYLGKMEQKVRPISPNVLPKLMKFYKVKNKREILG